MNDLNVQNLLIERDRLREENTQLRAERESLMNHKERMWAWMARAKLFARKIRAIKEFQRNTPTTCSTSYYSFLLKMELDKEMK